MLGSLKTFASKKVQVNIQDLYLMFHLDVLHTNLKHTSVRTY